MITSSGPADSIEVRPLQQSTTIERERIMEDVYLPPDVWNICRQFAKDMFDSSGEHYVRYRHASRSRVIDQIAFGKVAEFAVFKHLGTTFPDMNHYSARDKSWKADLFLGDTPVHVKSCLANTYDSWIFQYSDQTGFGRDSEIFDNPSGVVVPCIILRPHVTVYPAVDVTAVRKLLRAPLLKKHQGGKMCLYLDDLMKEEYGRTRILPKD